jgi:hypothetical protein
VDLPDLRSRVSAPRFEENDSALNLPGQLDSSSFRRRSIMVRDVREVSPGACHVVGRKALQIGRWHADALLSAF